ncbi:50S ribosome-binding GTPase [Candidatus Parcubacteria bacterium]|nr:50S ribosome-binding GTPase [Candidatus Parcubacteria bacterium]
MQRPHFVTITGRPGSGKSTLIKKLLEARTDLEIFRGRSFVTRMPRVGDVPDEYEYVVDGRFNEMMKAEEFLWTFPHGVYRVGTRKADIDKALLNDKSSVMALVPEAAAKLVQYIGKSEVVSFFLEPNPGEDLARMMLRGDQREMAEKRSRETRHWNLSFMRSMGVNSSYISTATENPPAVTALRTVLSELSKRGI